MAGENWPPCGPRGGSLCVGPRGGRASVWVGGAGDPPWAQRPPTTAPRPPSSLVLRGRSAHRTPTRHGNARAQAATPNRCGTEGRSMGPAPWEVRAPYPVLGPMAPLYLTPKGSTHVVGGAYRYVSRETCMMALRPPPRRGATGPRARRGEVPRRAAGANHLACSLGGPGGKYPRRSPPPKAPSRTAVHPPGAPICATSLSGEAPIPRK